MDQIAELKALHYEFVDYLKVWDWEKVNKRTREIIDTGDINKMKMVIIVTQTFREWPQVKQCLSLLQTAFDEKFKTL